MAELADQIRADPDGWRPDYTALRTLTGMGWRWCEYLVRDARTAAEQPRTPIRTGPARLTRHRAKDGAGTTITEEQ